MTAYLTKPIQQDRLAATMQTVVDAATASQAA